MNDNARANYLSSFKVFLIKHIRENLKFEDTSMLTKKEIKEAAARLLNRAVPLPPATFDWLRTILRYVKDKEQWLVYDNTTGLWHYEATDAQLRSIMCDYFQVVYEEATKAGDDVYALYACSFFGGAGLGTLVNRLKGGIQFAEPSASGLLDRTYGLRYFETTEGKRCLIDMSKDSFNMRTVRFSDTQDMMLQHIAPVPISVTDDPPELFLSLIDEYMLHDPDKVEYMYKVLAYMMAPYNYNQVLLYWIGNEGRNGKSTLIKVIQDILGPHSVRMNSDLINANPPVSFKKDDALAATEGRSLLVFNEIDERMVASTQNIKDLTEGGRDEFGNKIMTVVRPAYSKNYEINICGTPLVIANSLVNMGEWSNLAPIFKRLVLVSFDYKITKEDPTILNRLAQEYPKIQTWLYLNYFKHKGVCLKDEIPPTDFRLLKEQYNDDSDIIKMFWRDCIIETGAQEDSVLRSSIYKMYKVYCEANGRKPIKNKGTNGFSNLIAPMIKATRILDGNIYVVGVKRSAYYDKEIACM